MLSHEEIIQYHTAGYIGPYRLDALSDVRGALEAITVDLFADATPVSGHPFNARHLDSAAVLALCRRNEITERLARLYGPDLLLWYSSFWLKESGSFQTPWHQDLHYWTLPVSFTAWVALTDTTAETGCLRVIPGSHHRILPVESAGEASLFERSLALHHVDVDRAVDLEMKAGEFVIFGDRLVHSSAAFQSSSARRIAIALRYTLPWVKLRLGEPPFFAGYQAVLVRGHDHFGLNPVIASPTPADPVGMNPVSAANASADQPSPVALDATS